MTKAIVIGSGFAGCVIARELAENGFSVELYEKRKEIAGNMADYYDENGILVQKYGPHIIFTNNIEVIDYLSKFDTLVEHDCVMKSFIDGQYIQLPFNYKSIKELIGYKNGKEVIDLLREKYKNLERVSIYELLNSSNEKIRNFALLLFEKAFKPYIKKQWNLEDSQIDKSVINRVKFCLSYDFRYLEPDLQFLPKHGFSVLMKNMLIHPNIKVFLNENANNHITFDKDKILFDGKDDLVIYTGLIDELFNNKYGVLPYRSLSFEFENLNVKRALNCEIISFPQDPKIIRKTEYKYFNKSSNNITDDDKTLVVSEAPEEYVKGKNVPCYPVLNEQNTRIYSKYKKYASKYSNLYLCGRLAEYKYYNMDAVILHSKEVAKQIILQQLGG